MSDKVVITKDQAEAIERLLRNEWSKKQILICHFETPNGWDIKDNNGLTYNHLNHMDFEELVKALYIGYEVEPTPEEIILNRYNQAKEGAKDVANIYKQYEGGAVDAIEMVLRTLKIEIEGIHK